MWGKVRVFHVICLSGGITPTCVGKSSVLAIAWSTNEDHPHVCGEKLHTPKRKRIQKGSPPRVWGKVRSAKAVAVFLRITPTCVGKRANAYTFGHVLWDHPHVCGEKPTILRWTGKILGSPPRVWGKVKCVSI